MGNHDQEMSFLDHLEIFRWHLIRSAIAVLVFSIIAFIFKDIVFDIILLGPKYADFPTYKVLCAISQYVGLDDAFCFLESPFSLMNISMSGQFSTHIIASIFAGFVVAFPYVFWEFWRFISPALHIHETKMVRGIVFFSSVLFLFGICFGYFLIVPLSINFLGSYQVSSTVANQISLTSFISTVTTVSFATGVIFELPIMVYFLTKIGLLTPDFMRIYRRHSIVVILILAAIITPPDVTSQILVLLPLMILYEISIKISEKVIKNQKNN
ncbi:MAG: twin-arginine translocase subunit TatC [Bacteroidota bacterium]|nr:twin-arginine translocase subunit TatC [Bacteroidota bacterium]